LVETTLPAQMQKEETSLFDGIDTSVASLAQYAGAKAPKDLVEGLKVMTTAIQAAQKNFDAVNDAATMKPLLDGLFALRVLRRELRTMAIDDTAKFEIDFRLRQKEREFQQAATLAAGIKVEALADDGIVVPGQPVKVNVIVANRGVAEATVKSVNFEGFAADAECTMTAFTGGGGFGGGRGGRGGAPAQAAAPMSIVRKGQVAHCEPSLAIP